MSKTQEYLLRSFELVEEEKYNSGKRTLFIYKKRQIF